MQRRKFFSLKALLFMIPAQREFSLQPVCVRPARINNMQRDSAESRPVVNTGASSATQPGDGAKRLHWHLPVEKTVQENSWPRIAVMGAGAVGCYFGGMLARAGAAVTLIGRPRHVDAITRNGLFLDTIHFQQQIPISASTNVNAVRDADIVIFCVKTFDTEDAARSLAPHLASGAVVVSFQNGVDNVERIRAAANVEAIPAVVYVAVAMAAPGRVKHSGRGDLVIGNLLGSGEIGERRPRDLHAIAAVFDRAGVPCRVSENVEAELWTKMIMNCAYNAISALSRAKYGALVRHPLTRNAMIQVTEEAVAVARAAGVRLPGINMIEAVLELAETMSEATSSTAQDIARGNRTEIDSLNGYLVRRGAQAGVAVPVNQTLHALVKLLEESVSPHAG
jgi:2-dehydropantoate 2-reductase